MREVVVEQEATLQFALFQVVDVLLVFLGSECCGDHCLSFTACKEGGTVNSRQPTHFAADRPNLREPATIRPTSLVENVLAENSLLEMIEDGLGLLSLFSQVCRVRIDNFFLQIVYRRIAGAFFFVRSVESFAQSVAVVALDLLKHFLVQGRRRNLSLLDLQGLVKLVLPATEAIDFLVGKHQRLDHDLL